MRHLIKLFSLFTIVSLLISCVKKDDPYAPVYPNGGNNGGGGGGSFGSYTATIDGASFSPNDSVAASIMNGMINVTAYYNGNLLTISLQDDQAGLYIMDDSGIDGAAAYFPLGAANALVSNAYISDSSGFVNISSIDAANKKISGTFAFIVEDPMSGDTMVISQGAFTDVTYTTDLPATGSTISANVDGVPFNVSNAAALKVGGKISISGMIGSQSLGLNLPETTPTGTFSLGDMTADYNGLYSADATGANTYMSETGSVTITLHDVSAKKIEGTFSFTAKKLFTPTDSVVVDGGQFSVTYQ